MYTLVKRLSPVLMLLFVFAAVDWSMMASDADARSRGGGRSFRSAPAQKQSPQQSPSQMQQNRGAQQQQGGGFGRGLLGGLAGGALGAMLFGSMFGMGGSGMGILPLLLLGVAGYFFYRRFVRKPAGSSSPGYGPPPSQGGGFPPSFGQDNNVPPIQDIPGPDKGLAAVRRTDPGFDEAHFLEVASDVFFKVQAGWMRRDLASYRHLLGEQLAAEYAGHFKELEEKGQLNKLESIAIRKVEIVDAGSDGKEDYVTVLFTANLLDYTVDERSGAVVEGSTTEPVKFAEEWTWARPVRTENWLLEGIQVVQE
ncbi:MAG: Tim44 domain-containing protein [Desulfobulbaceae bacterium]|nr:Tim44 domain-containing protein [Desulfobulbaceae bacterium]